jgi:hypothetical protein
MLRDFEMAFKVNLDQIFFLKACLDAEIYLQCLTK